MVVDAPVNLVTVDKTVYWFTKEVCRNEAAALKLLYEQPQVANKVKDANVGLPLVIALEQRASVSVLLKLLLYHPEAASTPTPRGGLPLHMAASLGTDQAVVAKLLEIYPLGAREKDRDDCLPVHLALRQPLVPDSVAAMLLECYGYEEARIPRPPQRTCSVQHPLRAPQMSLVELIKARAPARGRQRSGATQAALELLEREPTLAQEGAADGALPLHMALLHGSEDELVLRLLALHPTAARHPDSHGNRPINIAMQQDRSDLVVSKLLAA